MKLKKLEPTVISKIRSSSSVISVSQCVFELVSNSLDAKSTSIAVRINVSNFRIQVADNGEGISREDMEVIGTRYTTNKCRNLEDLTRHISSYGFRGEALSSIIELSETVNVSSRQKDSAETYRVKFVNGNKEEVKDTKYRPSSGTTVTVYEFLRNLPVRRQRLIPEIGIEEIKKTLEYLIIINPGTSFTLRDDITGMLILNSPKTVDIIGSFRYLHPEIDKSFLLLKVSKSKVSLDCLIHKSFLPSKKFQFVYVNKRPVLSTKLQKFTSDAFVKKNLALNHRKNDLILAETNKYPVFVLNVKCANPFVDILQNPLECGVEFKDWTLIFSCVNKLVSSYFGDDKKELKVSEVENKREAKIVNRGVSQVYGAVKACAYKNKNLDQFNAPEDLFPENQVVNHMNTSKKRNKTREKNQKHALKPNENASACEFEIDKILEDLQQCDRENQKLQKKMSKRKRKLKSPESNFNFAKFQKELKNDFKQTSKDRYREKHRIPFVTDKTGKGPTQNTAGNYDIQDTGKIESIELPKLRSIMKKPLQISTENIENHILEPETTHGQRFDEEEIIREPYVEENEISLETIQNEEKSSTHGISQKSIFSTFTNDENKGKNLIMDMFLKSTQIFQSGSDAAEDEKQKQINNKSTDNSSQETVMESNFLLQNNYRDTYKGINATMSVSVNVKRRRPKDKKRVKHFANKTSKAKQTTICDKNMSEQILTNAGINYKPEFKRSKSNLSDLTSKLDNIDIRASKTDKFTDNYTILISGNVQKQPHFKFVPKEESQKTCSQLDMFQPFQQKTCRCRYNNGNFFNFEGKIEKAINGFLGNKNDKDIDIFHSLLASTSKSFENIGKNPILPQDIKGKMLDLHQEAIVKPHGKDEKSHIFKKPTFTCVKKPKAHAGAQYNNLYAKSPYFAAKPNHRVMNEYQSPYFANNPQQNVHNTYQPACGAQNHPQESDMPNIIQNHGRFPSNSQFRPAPLNTHVDGQFIYNHRLPYRMHDIRMNPAQINTYIAKRLHKDSENIDYARPLVVGHNTNWQNPNQYYNNTDPIFVHDELFIPNHCCQGQNYMDPVEFTAQPHNFPENEARNTFYDQHRLVLNPGIPNNICRHTNCCNPGFSNNVIRQTNCFKNQNLTENIGGFSDNQQICDLDNHNYRIVSLRYPEIPVQWKTREFGGLNAEEGIGTEAERWSQERNFRQSYISQEKRSPIKNIVDVVNLESETTGKSRHVIPDTARFHHNASIRSEDNLSKINYSVKVSSQDFLEIPSKHNFMKSPPFLSDLNPGHHKESVLSQKEKPLSSVLEISVSDEKEKQIILNRELEEHEMKNRKSDFFGSHDSVPAENKKSENPLVFTTHEKENSQIVIDSQNVWIKRCTDDGEKYYVNSRTGLLTKECPKVNQIHFNFDIRQGFIPKGMSPVLKGHKDVDKLMSQNAKKKLQEFILENYDNELLIVKWENYINDDPKQFFKEIYEEKSKLFESGIPAVCRKQSKFTDNTFSFSKKHFYNLQVIGQVDKKFIAVIEKENNMLILFDQHAVHERIRLEKLLRAYKGSKAPCNENVLLFVPQSDLSMLKKHTNYLSSLGLDLAFFPNGVKVKNMPLCIEEKCTKESSEEINVLLTALIKEIIELLKETRGSEAQFPRIIQNLINLKACRGAIKFGNTLSKEDCLQLLNDLSLCNLPFQCAHGRPTLTPVLNLNKIGEKKSKKVSLHVLQHKVIS